MKTLPVSYLQAVQPLSEQDHPVAQLDTDRTAVRGSDTLAPVNPTKGGNGNGTATSEWEGLMEIRQ